MTPDKVKPDKAQIEAALNALRHVAIAIEHGSTHRDDGVFIREALSVLTEALAERGWRPIEGAPKGGGAEYTTDPAWVEPPRVLLLFADGSQAVGYWDWCYAEDGNGYVPGMSAWIEPVSGEQVAMHYGEPTHWQPLPEPPHDR